MIEKLARDEPEKFATFYKAFGNTLKEGIGEDAANRERIAKLLRFASTTRAKAPSRPCRSTTTSRA